MQNHDYIIVGSGINALVAAGLLSKKRHSVLVLERNQTIGGCIISGEVTRPGFIHDLLATTFVLFTTSPAFAHLGADLARHGLEFCNSEYPTGVLLSDGRHAILSRDRAKNISTLDTIAAGDGARHKLDVESVEASAPFIFALLGGALRTSATAKLIARETWYRGIGGMLEFFGTALGPARGWLETRYRSDLARALWAPWVLHAGLGPESTYSAQMGRVIAFALEAAGAPIVKGGASRFLDAFSKLITEHGSEIRTGTDVDSIMLDKKGRAIGVKLADGSELFSRKGVICSTTPHQLYSRLLRSVPNSAAIADGLEGYRYGKGDMQIHYALSAAPKWSSPELAKVALLHLTSGLDGVSRAANEAERGLIPAEPTICVGQPTALDPSRAPQGGAILWLELPECPRFVKGDAKGEFPVPADARWTAELREAYADRVENTLARHISNFAEIKLARTSYSPGDLEAININLVGGDPYGGYCGIDQFFAWRPFKTSVNHLTPVKHLYHIGASTHPGPGLAGGSGFALAQSLG